MSGLKLENITKSFDGKTVLKDLSLNIKDGELLSLIGPSGCGKTTTLNIISGLLPPDRGSIFFNQRDLSRVPVERRGVALVDQDILLFPHMTVSENIGYGLKVRGVNPDERKERVSELLKLIHMENYGDRFPNELSGGQQQRVATARALAINPEVLLLDEPFSRLDISLRENMRQFVREIHEKVGITTILVTHDIQDTLAMSDRICILIDGEIHQIDKPQKVFQTPKNRRVAEYLGYRNFLQGIFKDNSFNTSIGKIRLEGDYDQLRHKEVCFLIRPELISLCSNEEKMFDGKIKELSFNGGLTNFKVEISGVELFGSSTRFPDANPGDPVPVAIDLTELVLLEKE